jgi:hypothetical protein
MREVLDGKIRYRNTRFGSQKEDGTTMEEFRKVDRDGVDGSYRMREMNKQMSPLQSLLDVTLCALPTLFHQARDPTQAEDSLSQT